MSSLRLRERSKGRLDDVSRTDVFSTTSGEVVLRMLLFALPHLLSPRTSTKYFCIHSSFVSV